MKRTKKILVTLLCAVLLVTGTVAVTVAYLTDSASVQNTFTFGQVGISLDEAKVNPDGTVIVGEGAGRGVGNVYHLIPGHTYVKDPEIHIDANSENCWIFVELNNGLKNIIDATTIEDQMIANGWTLVDGTSNIYAYKEIVVKGMSIPTFTEFNIKDGADVSGYDTNENDSAVIDIIAYAVQADGFGSAAAAWTATSNSFGK